MSDFRLIEGHIYKYGDRTIPGVTATLEANFGNRPYWSEWHAERGKAVHLAIHYLVNNSLNWDSVDERIRPRIEAFQKMLNETGFRVIDSEIKLFSRKYQFAGTIDLELADREDNWILADIKSSIEPTVELQLAAYSLLWEENYKTKVKKAAAIELKDNGDYNMKWFNDLKRAQRIFLANLTIANWRREKYDV